MHHEYPYPSDPACSDTIEKLRARLSLPPTDYGRPWTYHRVFEMRRQSPNRDMKAGLDPASR
jgi:hypothetical protein